MIYRNWKLTVMMLVCASLLGALGTVLLQGDNSGDGATTQSFTNASRYALLNAPVMVFVSNNGNRFTQDAVLKIDTATGNVWVLQMTILSAEKPTILAADFIPAQTQSTYSIQLPQNENPLNNSPNNF